MDNHRKKNINYDQALLFDKSRDSSFIIAKSGFKKGS